MSFVSLPAQKIYVVTSNDIFEFNPDDCTYSFVIHVNRGMFDISFDTSGYLYGISGKRLYKINESDGALTEITRIESSPLNAMTISSDNIVYLAGAGGELFSYNLMNGDSVYHGNIGFGAAGDLTFYKGDLYMAAFDNQLVKVNISDPPASELMFTHQATDPILGIVSDFVDCEDITCYAIASNDSEIYKIDFENKALILVCQLQISIGGGASTSEFMASIKVSTGSPSLVHPNCYDQGGKIFLNESSGHGELMYNLDHGTWQTTPYFENLQAGVYWIYMVDQLGCKDSTRLELLKDAPMGIEDVNFTIPDCNQANGSIEVLVEGGSGIYQYSLDSLTFQSSNLFSLLSPQVYSVYIKDDKGCQVSSQATLPAPTASEILSFQTSPSSCGFNNGSIEVITNAQNGSSFSIGNGIFQSGNFFENLAPGSYLITLLDDNQCRDTASAMVEDIPAPTLTVESIIPANCGNENGRIIALGTGGNEPYSFSLDQAQFQGNGHFDLIAPGMHSISILDAMGCNEELIFEMVEIDPPIIQIIQTQPSECATNTGRIEVQWIAAATPVKLELINSGHKFLETWDKLPAGTYTINLTDNLGCKVDTFVTVWNTDCPFFIPNVFSPNGDGINDEFIIRLMQNQDLEIKSFKVVDRWGNVVFMEVNNLENVIQWNGSFQGRILNPGVFAYQLIILKQGVEETITGDLTLIR